MRALLVDDEEWARHALRRALEAIPGIEVAGEAANGLEALEQIELLRPDVLFLDVEMPAMSGLETLAQLREPPLVIFVTAYSEYAVQAFEANAVDYLLKPLRPERLEAAVERARTRIPNRVPEPLLRQVRPLNRIAVRRGKRILLLPRHEILYARVEEELVFLYAGSGRYSIDRTLAELEELLDGGGFFRVSRSALVNLEAVTEMYPWLASGTWRVKLSDATELDVSRERARLLKSLVGL